ncbi:MAG: zf-HC2 domain-containing protein [Bacteroidota bacterium]
MTHLTMSQILQYIDGTADYASQAQCTSHLAVCERCRREAGLHKKLLKTGRQNLYRTSSRFIENVMAIVAPQPKNSWAAKILNNLANIFSMMLVLGVLGYAISAKSDFKFTESPQYSAMTKVFTDAYAKLRQSANEQTRQVSVKVTPGASNKTAKLIIFSVLALLTLGAVDRFVVRRIIKTRM